MKFVKNFLTTTILFYVHTMHLRGPKKHLSAVKII